MYVHCYHSIVQAASPQIHISKQIIIHISSRSLVGPNLSLLILCCSLFQRSLNSWQKDSHRPKNSFGLTNGPSPGFGLTAKYAAHCWNLKHNRLSFHTYFDKWASHTCCTSERQLKGIEDNCIIFKHGIRERMLVNAGEERANEVELSLYFERNSSWIWCYNGVMERGK